MKNRAVSIIIPAYNEEKFLPSCLESINRLDYPKDFIDVIVVDNGSKDRTVEIAKSYGAKIFINDKKNVSGLRNIGAAQSKNDILAFVDADCIVKENWLKMAEKYCYMSDVAAWGSPPAIPEETTWVQRAWYLVRQKDKQVQKVDWLESMNLFVRKEHFLAIAGFNENLITCEDADLSYRIKKYGHIISDNNIAVIHLGEARTVKDFIKKELWRGRSNFYGMLSHGFILKEIPSLSIPIYFGFFLPILFVFYIVSLKPFWIVAFLLFYLLPSAMVLFKVMKKKIDPIDLLRMLILVQIYFFTRTIAVFKRA